MVVAGAVAQLRSWERLEADWVGALKEFAAPALHMKDFAHSRRAFKDWPESKRQEFLGRLMSSMDRNVKDYIGAAISLRIHRSLKLGDARHLEPYYGCFIWCLNTLVKSVAGLPRKQKIEVVLASQPKMGGLAFDIYEEAKSQLREGWRLGSLSFASPADVIPLQVADWVAYELRQHLARKINGDDRIRWAMEKMRNKSEKKLRLIHYRASEEPF